jgi:alkanesulfonate monooxygenase SsuD/methylene tetrahydromethanopterin reductase-like flavin-dependent oxidoreductase (luciferase family)
VRHGINLAPFGPLAEPRATLEVAAAAEQYGWDGLFVWDHLMWVGGPQEVADPWVLLSAIAATTHRIRIGPMVTPLPRRRVQVVAKQSVTLDHLSRGRLVLGAGAGGDARRELSAFGEGMDGRERAARLEESLEALVALWSGETVSYRGRHVVIDGAVLSPLAVQRPRIPIWVGVVGGHDRAVRRAARYDGIFPIDVDIDRMARIVDTVRAERGSLEDFEVVAAVLPGVDTAALEALGVTWFMHSFWTDATPARVMRFLERGPDRATP